MDEVISCPFCFRDFKGRYAKSCGNCFACTGCEIYYCPYCKEEIVIKPMKKID